MKGKPMFFGRFVPVSVEVLADVPTLGEWIAQRLRWAHMGSDPWPSKGFSPHLVDARTRVRAMRYEDEVCDECGCDGSCR